MASLVVKIALNADGKLAAAPIVASQGDTVMFISDLGKVQVNFPGPFGNEIAVQGNREHKVTATTGRYPFRCGVTTPQGKKMGWPDHLEQSEGGEIEIGHRSS